MGPGRREASQRRARVGGDSAPLRRRLSPSRSPSRHARGRSGRGDGNTCVCYEGEPRRNGSPRSEPAACLRREWVGVTREGAATHHRLAGRSQTLRQRKKHKGGKNKGGKHHSAVRARRKPDSPPTARGRAAAAAEARGGGLTCRPWREAVGSEREEEETRGRVKGPWALLACFFFPSRAE